MIIDNNKNRCFGTGKPLYAAYHDNEWGVAVHDDQKLFEMLILEGAQAGLTWETVLNKRHEYRKVFYNFDAKKVSAMTDEELDGLMSNKGIIRNRLKIYSVRKNAQVFLALVQEYGTFNDYLWRFVNNKPLKHECITLKDLPTTVPQSDALSKDLKKRGMNFVGSTIIYAFMQAVGMVDDHLIGCWRYRN